MRKFLLTAALGVIGATVILPAGARCQQPDQKTDTNVDPKQQQQQVHGAQGPQSAASAGADSQYQDQDKNSSATPQTITLTPGSQDSLGAAARKTREQKRDSAKSIKVFTNDNIPGGAASKTPPSDSASATKTGGDAAAAASPGKDEKAWREKFAKLHQKLDRDKEDIGVMQRELGVLDVQYYNDPVKAMQQQLTRSDINDKTAKIDAKKKEIEADQQAIDDAEDDLRKAGGDPGWAR
jgi:hypothetical protein